MPFCTGRLLFSRLAFSKLQKALKVAPGDVCESFQKTRKQERERKKKAKTITPPRSVTPSESCRGQLGCHEEFASAAPVCFFFLRVGKADKLNRVNLSTGKPAGSVSGPVRSPELKHSSPLHSVLESFLPRLRTNFFPPLLSALRGASASYRRRLTLTLAAATRPPARLAVENVAFGHVLIGCGV